MGAVRKRIEKDTLIKILDCCIEDDCFHCPNAYKDSSIAACEAVARGSVHIPFSIMRETIEALKKQEAVEPTFKQDEVGIFVWACGLCGAYMYHIYDGIDKAKEYAKYCRQCGRAVKWNGRSRSMGNDSKA